MIVDVAFNLIGRSNLPCDHGYVTASAISRIVPQWHSDSAVGIHPISGRVMGNRSMRLDMHSRLRVRISADRITECIPLASTALRLGRATCQLGTLTVEPLRPEPMLRSRIVTIKGYLEADEFKTGIMLKLVSLGVAPEQVQVTKRRTLNIKRTEVVGFEVLLNSLTEDQSLAIQSGDMWSRRRFGCGVFVPVRRKVEDE